MNDRLYTWLTAEIDVHYSSYTEFAQEAGVSGSLVSMVLSGKREPTADFCLGAAKALHADPIHVLRLAGHLPPSMEQKRQHDAFLDEAVSLLEALPDHARRTVLAMLRGVVRSEAIRVGQGEQDPALTHRDRMIAFEQLPITEAMAGDCNPDPYQALRRALALVWETAPREERGRYFLETAIDIVYEGQRASHDE